MRVPIELPRLVQEMESALVIAWLKEIGEAVAAGEPVVEVEAEKASVEIEAPAGGWLVEITAAVDAEVAVGGVLGYIGDAP